jgi:hypothetical protein
MIIFVQARRDRSGWKRAAICIGMGIALIAFIGVAYSQKEDVTDKSMFSVNLIDIWQYLRDSLPLLANEPTEM